VTKCKGCGRSARKTTIAMLLTPDGLKGACVCRDCARGGVLLVAPKLGPIVKQKVVKSDGVERALRSLRAFERAAMAGVSPEMPSTQFHMGREDGLRSAIEVLKRECGE
jgi:hypothetical protein